MTRPSIQIEEQIADPYFCETEGDFHKLCIATCRVHTNDSEEAILFVTGLRVILHEYLALILSQKMQPYEMPKEWVDQEIDGFKGAISYVNEYFTKIGMPLYEGKNGKIEIDYEKLRKEFEEEK